MTYVASLLGLIGLPTNGETVSPVYNPPIMGYHSHTTCQIVMDNGDGTPCPYDACFEMYVCVRVASEQQVAPLQYRDGSNHVTAGMSSTNEGRWSMRTFFGSFLHRRQTEVCYSQAVRRDM